MSELLERYELLQVNRGVVLN